MPLSLAVVLWLGLSTHSAHSCLQCSPEVQEALSKLRFALVPSRFDQERTQARAQSLLLGMEGPFFRDYAHYAFVGKVDSASMNYVENFVINQTKTFMDNSIRDESLLEQLVTFRRDVLKELKKVLKDYQVKACHPRMCSTLKEAVLDCLLCQTVVPECVKSDYCFVNRQPRIALKYNSHSEHVNDQAKFGIIVSVCLAVFLFLVLVFSACMYRQNRKLLLQ
ncbi:PREDICTED: izumo sperm-egg fusion protein 2 [Elephantulus edwardii]|uniref:izumo sperm-egg fusion protein 2 n=1 Tax=Elephantulus edwardii TaxID=28737 RepID=UPI0003F05BA6|nr:PREDICTED: izumo sperm-egg fusion protein 2 [Elephantulus edwardii]